MSIAITILAQYMYVPKSIHETCRNEKHFNLIYIHLQKQIVFTKVKSNVYNIRMWHCRLQTVWHTLVAPWKQSMTWSDNIYLLIGIQFNSNYNSIVYHDKEIMML